MKKLNLLLLIFTLFLLTSCTLQKNTFTYSNQNLGFSFELPSIIKDNIYFEDETINTIYIKFKGEQYDSIIVTIQEMSETFWNKM